MELDGELAAEKHYERHINAREDASMGTDSGSLRDGVPI
jgi:hypothetical protein